jgi:hypothetical protein
MIVWQLGHVSVCLLPQEGQSILFLFRSEYFFHARLASNSEFSFDCSRLIPVSLRNLVRSMKDLNCEPNSANTTSEIISLSFGSIFDKQRRDD